MGSCESKSAVEPESLTVSRKEQGQVTFLDVAHVTIEIDQNGRLSIDDKPIKISVKFKYATSYEQSYYSIDEDDKLWSWGKNDFGRLGQVDELNRFVPEIVPKLRSKRIRQVTASNDCVACTTYDDECYVWGTTGGLPYFTKKPFKIFFCV